MFVEMVAPQLLLIIIYVIIYICVYVYLPALPESCLPPRPYPHKSGDGLRLFGASFRCVFYRVGHNRRPVYFYASNRAGATEHPTISLPASYLKS